MLGAMAAIGAVCIALVDVVAVDDADTPVATAGDVATGGNGAVGATCAFADGATVADEGTGRFVVVWVFV